MAIKDFAGASAVITGGASGIGLACAMELYARGANIVLADLNTQGLQQAENRLQEQHPQASGRIISIPSDVTSEAQVRNVMEQCLATFGSIDLVITSAGIGRGGPIDSFPASEMQRMMDINFMGTFHCIQQALPAMRRQGAGHIVCLSSVAGKLGNPFLAGYCASKWAVRGFTSAVRAELEGSGIDITTVYPAWVQTPLIQQEHDPVLGNHIEALLTAEQVARAILEAVAQNQRDLTLIPNPDIQRALEVYQADPEQAERKMGRAARQAMPQMQQERG